MAKEEKYELMGVPFPDEETYKEAYRRLGNLANEGEDLTKAKVELVKRHLGAENASSCGCA